MCYHTGDCSRCQEQCVLRLSMLTYYYLWLCHSCTAPRWCPSLRHTTKRTGICAFGDSIFFPICQVFYPWQSSMILSQDLPSPLHRMCWGVLLTSLYYESHWPLPACLSMILLSLQSRCSAIGTTTPVGQSSCGCLLQTVSSVIS